ncbi:MULTISPECIES: AzlD domain-containing protein [unclassified Mycolicibacterium]|uniref:branched-chain amino acid transporter permease n=1 Tax=unclassified Mycolicibacterium TaxID=2636767 RepID=UPI001F4BE68B|nr:AzlD domain-containing protein [Mycolicibacterium sp. YH-1]UNB49998.1 AzlD domain-containing protein [Mycolicibacterium sp. YH-1]
MADPAHIAAMVAVSAVITWALRALPFAALAPLRRSVVVRYLSLHMPLGVMVILAFYTLRGIPTADGLQRWAALAALAVTVGVHLWRRNLLLSIVGGTLTNVVIASLL